MVLRILKAALAATALASLSLPAAASAEIETAAGYAYMIDYDTGTVLLNKRGEDAMHPSSMTKLMTSYVLDRKIKEGRLKLDDELPVSEKAWRMQGSKMFVHVGSKVKVEDLIRGIIIQSGNDACIVVAEGISGSEEAFAQEMNKVGKEIGLTGSRFLNATGWPDEGHLMTPRDLAVLSRHIIREFPENYKYYAETSYTYNNIQQANRNRLLGNDIGVDGLKTGHTEVAGYGIALSAKNPADGRRQILVINGLPSDNARMEEGDKILRWGFREFTNRTLAKAGEVVGHARVWYGAKPEVPLVAENDVAVTLPVGDVEDLSFLLRYNEPVPAPIAKGAHVADLVVKLHGKETNVIPLVAAEEVERMGFMRRGVETLKYYFMKYVVNKIMESGHEGEEDPVKPGGETE